MFSQARVHVLYVLVFVYHNGVCGMTISRKTDCFVQLFWHIEG